MNIKKVVASFLVIALFITFFAFSNKDKGTSDSTNDPSTSSQDKALTETFVGKIGEEKLYTSEFYFFLYTTIGENISTLEDYPVSGTQQEIYDFCMLKLFDSNGKPTELCNTIITDTISECQKDTMLKIKAYEAGYEMTEENKTTLHEQIDGQVDSLLASYGTTYGVTTRDEILKIASYGYKVNDYKRYAEVQTAVASFSEKVKADYKYTEDEVVAFYNENIDTYKQTKIRYIYVSTDTSALDSTSETYETDKAELLKASQDKRDTVLALIKQGTALDNVAKGFSDSSSVATDLGVASLTKSDSANLPEQVVNWALAQTEETKIADTKVIEVANDGYYIVLCEGYATYDNDSTIKSTVLADFLTDKWIEDVYAWATLEEYKVTDIDNDSAVETIKSWVEQLKPIETATPTATPAG